MEPKAAAHARLDAVRTDLMALSHRIHAHPELGFEEERAATWLAETLTEAGFAVTRGICDLPTAFMARAGQGPLHLAICAEYDCLPGIGHACGHNIIAAMSAGAGIAVAEVADDLGLTVHVIGTPAEEMGGGGKILLLERGAFVGMHAAMMVHPAPTDEVTPVSLANSYFEVRYTGKEAHAAAFPERGVNAADALTIAQVALGLLRQHIRATDRIHGIITKGGDAPNIIPAHTAARYAVRAETLDDLEAIRTKVLRCFEAGALATGATLEIGGQRRPYAQLRHDPDIAAAYRRNAEALGRVFPDPTAPSRPGGSTDMGNVSLALPSIHPKIGINSWPATNHQPEFAAHCVTSAADQALMDGALAMAWTAIDLAQTASIRNRLLGGTSA
ncbi:MAG TPA: M20 family metallopeptidase [Candidatus Tectomicrobia bacterium]|nr:M20 family metallopeptidase [Candidatus Tectomicrobia bacterium]